MIETNAQRIIDNNKRMSLNIANAYTKAEAKGATLPTVQNSDNLAETIESIEQGSGGWQPQPDWFDIETILETDAEEYAGKAIALIGDEEDETTIYGRNASKIVTSDGVTYDNTQTTTLQSTKYLHTWDRSKDKGSTRYIVWYYENVSVNISPQYYENPMYMIFKGLNINYSINGNNPPFANLKLLQAITFKNSVIVNTNSLSFAYDTSLKKIKGIRLKSNVGINLSATKLHEIPEELEEKGILGYQCISGMSNLEEFPTMKLSTNIGNSFNSLASLRKIYYLDTSKVTSFRNFGNNCPNLTYIENLDFSSLADKVWLEYPNFSAGSNLTTVNRVLNIKVTGISFSACKKLNYETLLRFIDALYDYSEDTENTHTITFGATNLAKLTEEDLARITSKGWTAA